MNKIREEKIEMYKGNILIIKEAINEIAIKPAKINFLHERTFFLIPNSSESFGENFQSPRVKALLKVLGSALSRESINNTTKPAKNKVVKEDK